MTKAYLRESTLIKADLHSAVLTGANLELAHATGAIFDGAMLREANFRGTHLQGASSSTLRHLELISHGLIFTKLTSQDQICKKSALIVQS